MIVGAPRDGQKNRNLSTCIVRTPWNQEAKLAPPVNTGTTDFCYIMVVKSTLLAVGYPGKEIVCDSKGVVFCYTLDSLTNS